MKKFLFTVCLLTLSVGLSFTFAKKGGVKPEFDCTKMPNQNSCESGNAKADCTWIEDGEGFCTATPVCGDGELQYGEACDDGNSLDTDACLTTCEVAVCGDGIVQEGVEACDDGNDVDTDACLSSCEDAVCGDGIVYEGVEECDGGEGCTASCEIDEAPTAQCDAGEGFEGVDQTYNEDPYVVCRADDASAWVSSVGFGEYNAIEICNFLGYESVDKRGGTCGTTCGYCGDAGREYYDGGGYGGDDYIRFTVNWLCGDRSACIE